LECLGDDLQSGVTKEQIITKLEKISREVSGTPTEEAKEEATDGQSNATEKN